MLLLRLARGLRADDLTTCDNVRYQTVSTMNKLAKVYAEQVLLAPSIFSLHPAGITGLMGS